MSFCETLNEKEEGLLPLIRKEFFDHPCVDINPQIQGYKMLDGVYTLGCSAGPGRNLNILFHEMGHLAEREVPKLLERPNYGWGYTSGRFWQIGTSWGYEPQTDQSLLRELRVWAFQKCIASHYGLEEPTLKMVAPATYINSFDVYRYKHNLTIEKTLETLADKVDELSQDTFTFDRFVKDWNSRMEILNRTLIFWRGEDEINS